MNLISIADVWIVYVRFANYSQCPFCKTSLRLDLQKKRSRMNDFTGLNNLRVPSVLINIPGSMFNIKILPIFSIVIHKVYMYCNNRHNC